MKRKVKFIRRNWEVDYIYDIIHKRGFVISEPATINEDDIKQKSLYGARSPLYVTDYEDEQAFIERYRCKCGEFKGKQFLGETCPLCETKIEFKDVDIGFTGWIALGNNFIIMPYYYNLISDCMGKGILQEIIETKNKVDTDGNIIKASTIQEILSKDKPKHPFIGIGLIEFRNRFKEIMEFFMKTKKNKAKIIKRLLQERSNIFVAHIPIYTTLLRPQSATTDSYYYNSVDRNVNPLFNLSEKIKNCQDIEKDFVLCRIQKRVNKIWDLNFDLLNGKDGFIRDQILGGSLNETSRNVIIPDVSLRDNEVDVSYNTFRILFKNKIIHYLMKLNDIPLGKAYTIWAKSFMFDNMVYEVMNYIIQKEQPRLLINRNPTLNYYSMILMKIRRIKADVDDFTLAVPLSILPGLNADFDGDILNIIALMLPELVKVFRKFDPVTRMIISRDTGLLNDYFMITKDQMINLYYFCTME